MHIPSLVKIHWHLLKLSSGKENMGMSQAEHPSKFEEICSLAILNQISTISMRIPNLVKIHWCLLKLSSGNEKWMDGRTYVRLKDWWKDGHMDIQRETIIPCHYFGKIRRFRSSCTCTKYHLGLCSPFILSVVSNNSVSGQQRSWPDCPNAQADADLQSAYARRLIFRQGGPFIQSNLMRNLLNKSRCHTHF